MPNFFLDWGNIFSIETSPANMGYDVTVCLIQVIPYSLCPFRVQTVRHQEQPQKVIFLDFQIWKPTVRKLNI